MSKYLGIDYGEKRVGIAVSDNDGKLAFPKIVLENDAELLDKINNICIESKIDAIVIGESKNYKGEDNKINPDIISFKKKISSFIKLPTFLEPEFMSSIQVEKTFGKTGMLDASAAAIILQTYMDKEKNRIEKKEKAELDPVKKETLEEKPKITYDDFKKIEMTVGKILSAEIVPGSSKLYKLSVDFKEVEPRQIVSGIANYFDSQALVGKKVVFVTNLEPRNLIGLESNGMILAVKANDKIALMEVPDFIEEGSQLS